MRRVYGIIGPFIVNDVGGGSTEMLETVGRLDLPYIAMHGRKPKGDVIEDILDFFRDFAIKAGEYAKKYSEVWFLKLPVGDGKHPVRICHISDELFNDGKALNVLFYIGALEAAGIYIGSAGD